MAKAQEQPTPKSPALGQAVAGLTLTMVEDNFFESFSSILNSPDARGMQLQLGEAISFEGEDPWAVSYGSFAVAINDFGKIRNRDGISLGKWVKANTPTGEDAHLPETLKITKVIKTPKYKLSAYIDYEEKKGGFDKASGDEITKLSAEIRTGGLLEDAREKPGYEVPARFFHHKAEATW